MKKLITFFLSLVIAVLPVSIISFAEDELFTQEQIDYYASLGLQGTTVNVYNWGEYISDGSEGSMDVVHEFERLTGAKVNYTNYESNENMYSKLSGGGVSYDVIAPSDYMIARLIEENMLLEIDWNNVPNISLIDDSCKNLYFDPEQKYSLCYNVGTTVLIYNTKFVDEVGLSFGTSSIRARFLCSIIHVMLLPLHRLCSVRISTVQTRLTGRSVQSFLLSREILFHPFM